MGLSASQARLLSITQRLSDNELHSEILANSKMRLADESIIAKNNYLNALNSTKLQYTGFDGYGNANTVDLTFNSLMAYSEIKNQNILRNSNGQVLISDTDAYNYETSATMYEFLNKYGLYDTVDYAEQLAAIEAWEQAYQDYLVAHDVWQNVDMPAYYEAIANAGGSNEEDVYQRFAAIVGTSSQPLSCYASALSTRPECYKHVLMYLLYPINDGHYNDNNQLVGFSPTNPGTLQTSIPGTTITPTQSDWKSSALHGKFLQDNITDENGNANQLLPVYNAMLDEATHLCDGDDDLNTAGEQNLIEAAITAERVPYDYEILMSDYTYIAPNPDDPDNQFGSCGGKKSLRQKAIDMLELIKNTQTYFGYTGSMPSSVWASMKKLLINFTDGDMRGLSTIEMPLEPLFTEERPSLPLIKCEDKAKTQWYINLWYAIDGQENPNELRAIYDEDGAFSHYTIEDAEKQTTYDSSGHVLNPSYSVLPDELRSDANWLQHALANGIVTLNQMILDSNNNELVWAGFEYTSTSSFIEVSDDKKVAQAEAEYQTEMKRIETEDSKIDMKIKKLDTEHSALKTEYDSIAQLIGKNIERSYNTFNA